MNCGLAKNTGCFICIFPGLLFWILTTSYISSTKWRDLLLPKVFNASLSDEICTRFYFVLMLRVVNHFLKIASCSSGLMLGWWVTKCECVIVCTIGFKIYICITVDWVMDWLKFDVTWSRMYCRRSTKIRTHMFLLKRLQLLASICSKYLFK